MTYLYVGRKTYWQYFLNGMKEKFSVAHSQLEGNGSNVCFLRRKITEVEGGLIMTPGTSVSKVVQNFEELFGVARVQRVPCSTDIQLVDNSPQLNARDGKAFRSIVGLCLYVGRERPDLMFTIKELASAMSCPTVTSLQRLRKMVGYMKFVGDIGVRLQAPIPGQGKHLDGSNCQWVLESYGDADWSANKAHRRSTSCGMHFLNNAFVYGSSRSQKTISLSSCESELHSLVSCMCDGIFIVACAEFVLGEKLEHVQYTDSSSARQLASRQGVGKVRHLSGKILWVQEKVNDGTVNLRQVPTVWNVADIGTKCLNQQRMMVLMHETGLVYIPTGEPVGAEEYQRQSEKTGNQRQLQKITKAILTDEHSHRP